MAEWKEVVLKGGSIADLGMIGVAAGDTIIAGADPFTFEILSRGTNGQVLTAGASTISWATPASGGDFKADGTVAMTAPLRLLPNAGESGMGVVDGSIFYDTTADKLKVYVA